MVNNDWLVVTGTWLDYDLAYIYIYILGISSSQLTNSIIFQRGRYTTNQNKLNKLLFLFQEILRNSWWRCNMDMAPSANGLPFRPLFVPSDSYRNPLWINACISRRITKFINLLRFSLLPFCKFTLSHGKSPVVMAFFSSVINSIAHCHIARGQSHCYCTNSKKSHCYPIHITPNKSPINIFNIYIYLYSLDFIGNVQWIVNTVSISQLASHFDSPIAAKLTSLRTNRKKFRISRLY